MKSRLSKNIFITLFILINIIIATSISDIKLNSLLYEEKNSELRKSPSVILFTDHDPIYIISNQNFTDTANLPENQWPGDGSKDDPYVIKGLNITSSTSRGIWITNVDFYFTITDCFVKATSSGLGDGIILSLTKNGLVINNTIEDSGRYGVYMSSSQNNTIFNNTISNCTYDGVYCGSFASDNDIVDNTIFNCTNGIGVGTDESYNYIANNTIYQNEKGIRFSSSANNTVFSNTITDNEYGIHLDTQCLDNKILNNSISEQFYDGIYLYKSRDNLIANNTIWDNNYGINLWDSCTGNNIECNKLRKNRGTSIRLNAASYNTVFQNSIINNSYRGIFSYGSDNEVINNTLINIDGTGILVDAGGSNDIINNTISNCTYDGIYLVSSGFYHNNIISNNSITDAKEYGIHMYQSPNNTIIHNEMNYCGMYFTDSNQETYIQFEVTGNLVNGKKLVFYQSLENVGTLQPDLGQIVLINSSNAIISNQILSNTSVGIIVVHCNNTIIRNNTISQNIDGIRFNGVIDSTIEDNVIERNDRYGFYLERDSDNNTIFGNVLDSNNDGITIAYCENNSVYNNTILSNEKYAIEMNRGTNTTIKYNNIIGNNLGTFTLGFVDGQWVVLFSQADDSSNYGTNNTFEYNFWEDWTKPDTTPPDGIVDFPYEIAGDEENNDPYPVTTAYETDAHYIIRPSIIEPNGSSPITGTVTISWTTALDSEAHDIVYNAYYTTSLFGGDWKLIDDGLTSTSCEWDSLVLLNGSACIIKVNASCSEGRRTAAVSNLLWIDHPHVLPEPTLVYPNGGESLSGTVTIEWSNSSDPLGHEVNFTIYYSADGGNTWVTLATDLTNNTFNWDTTSVVDGANYLIRINASCSEGLWVIDTSDNVFSINNQAQSELRFKVVLPIVLLSIVLLLFIIKPKMKER